MVTPKTTPMIESDFGDSTLFQFSELLAVDGFRHTVTSKPWNMATHCGPNTESAVKRRRAVCDRIGLPFERLIAPEQVHSPHVIRVTAEDAGRGRDGRHTALRFVDGMVCAEPDLPLMQFSADCPLVVAVDPVRRVFGTAHASWRGTVAGITTELLRQLHAQFGVAPSELVAAVCPCAGPQEYEVGDDVRRVAVARLGRDATQFFRTISGRLYFDMRGANVDQLIRAGVRPDRIVVAAPSTMTDDRFYSFRRDGDNAGRFALVAGFASRI